MTPNVEITPRDAAIIRLVGACRGLGDGEMAVLEAIARRLLVGRQQYGALRPVNDSRDWHKEASEELLDGCVYLACETLRQRSKR